MSPSLVAEKSTASKMLAQAGSRAKNLLFPPVCPMCRADTSEPEALCAECWKDTAFLSGAGCKFCSYPLEASMFGNEDLICDDCVAVPKLWRRGRAVFRYEGTGRNLVLGLKHGDRLDRVPILADLAVQAAQPLVDTPGVIVPVPLHWRRLMKRRANQVAEVARGIRARSPILSYAPQALKRVRNTESQEGKNRDARIANVSDAIQAGRKVAKVAGKRVLLLDDVMTTGATLNAAAKVCLDQGASSVDVLVLALVVRDQKSYIAAAQEDGYETS